MPELPEVETVRRDLAPLVIGKRISRLEVLLPRMVRRGQSPGEVESRVAGGTVGLLERHGKFLALGLDTGERLVFHLGMTGQLLYRQPGESRHEDRYTHVVVTFEDGARLYLRDIRQFGEVFLLPRGDLGGQLRLGLDLLDARLSANSLAGILRSPTKVKALLLNQRKLSGLGNIYADEALSEAGIHPVRPARALSQREVGKLHRAILHVVEEAIGRRGSTTSDFV